METQYSGVFWKIYDAVAQQHPRVVINEGGARSTKTYSILQFLDLVVQHDNPGDITSVVSESLPHLKKGAIRDFEQIKGGDLKGLAGWSESEHALTYPNGAKLEFFSVDAPAKVHGPQRRRLFVNEANHISYETYRQLAIRTSGLILMDYNPTSAFWAIDRVGVLPNVVKIHSTYKDNPFLSAAQVAEIESNEGDSNWWRVYGLGLVGQLEGTVFDFRQVDEMPDAHGLIETWGIDFGFTHDPTAIVRTLIDTARRIIYVDQRCYRKRMLNADIIALLKAEGVAGWTPIYADCAEPKTIEEIYRAGYDCRSCYKAARVAEQLQWMQGWTICVTKESLDLINEGRNYTWAKDKNGNDLNEPIDKWNHAIDATRYATFSHLMGKGGDGYYDYIMN